MIPPTHGWARPATGAAMAASVAAPKIATVHRSIPALRLMVRLLVHAVPSLSTAGGIIVFQAVSDDDRRRQSIDHARQARPVRRTHFAAARYVP
jgi:hypothetical protein